MKASGQRFTLGTHTTAGDWRTLRHRDNKTLRLQDPKLHSYLRCCTVSASLLLQFLKELCHIFASSNSRIDLKIIHNAAASQFVLRMRIAGVP